MEVKQISCLIQRHTLCDNENMPMFDFKCKNCSYEFEDIVSLSDTFPNCPVCQADTERLFSGHSTFVLVGAGWAADGYHTSQNASNPDQS